MLRFEPSAWHSRILNLEAWIELHWVMFLLRTPWRQRLFAVPAPRTPSSTGEEKSISKLELARWLPRVEQSWAYSIKTPTCLERSLTLQRMLRRRGLQAHLRIGVRQDCQDDLEAHAWLEHPDLPPDLLSQDYRTLEGPRP